MMLLFIQYFKNGWVVVARNLICLACKIKVVMFQLIINMATAAPTKERLKAFTFPRYSGYRYSMCAPKRCIKSPLTVLNNINQNTNSTWYRLK